jgi:hypothetical protein
MPTTYQIPFNTFRDKLDMTLIDKLPYTATIEQSQHIFKYTRLTPKRPSGPGDFASWSSFIAFSNSSNSSALRKINPLVSFYLLGDSLFNKLHRSVMQKARAY